MLAGNSLKRHYNLSQVLHTVTLVQGNSIASLEWVCWREKEEKRVSQKSRGRRRVCVWLNERGGARGGTVSAFVFSVILLLHSKAARHSAGEE